MAGDFGPHGALQNLVSVNYSLPKDEQGNLTIPSQAAADYLDEQPKIIPHDKTWREKTVDWAADKMMEYGASPQSAYKYSRKVFGGGNELMGIGVADVTPAGLVFAGEEAVRGYKEGDVVMPTVELALSAAEAYPLTKAILRPARKLFQAPDNPVQAPDNPVDESKRRFMKGAAGAPAALGALGALGGIKVGTKLIDEGGTKLIDDILPVASKSVLKLPQSIFDLRSFKSVDAALEKLFPSGEESFGLGTSSLLAEMSDFSEKYFLSSMTSGDLSKLLKEGGGEIDPLTPIIKELEEKGLSKSEMAEYLFRNDIYDPSEEAKKVLGLAKGK
jgi:hypothetical protein